MAINIREMPIWVQVLAAAVLAVALVAMFELVPYSPLQAKNAELQQKTAEAAALHDEVVKLQVNERLKAQLKTEIDALNKSLENRGPL